MAIVSEARGLTIVNQKNQPSVIKVAGAWVDTQTNEEALAKKQDTDLSYWSALSESYEPEWFPLGVTLPSSI